ncbi:glycosyltransferase [Microbacterium thalassium]|nr:glycosyltransferase [Microbacterium thalassium]
MPGLIVHEWLEASGGSENVFETLVDAFPDAGRLCLWNDSGGRFTDVDETILARTPLRRNKALALPFMPAVWRSLPERDADWILASSHVFAHHARFGGPARDVPKLVYAHTPARYVWVPELDQRGDSLAARAISAALKPIDRRRAAEPTAIAANSRYIAARIAEKWDREAEVIYPPVDVGAFAAPLTLTDDEQRILDALPSEFLLGVSRFVPYKRLDAVIEAGLASGMPVVLAGAGPEERHLREIGASCGIPVELVHRPSYSLLRALYRRASALVFAPVEDFGIVPVEAMASGTPVIANAVGGASESVIEGVTGAHVTTWKRGELREAVARALEARPQDCIARAEDFDTCVFTSRIRSFVGAHAGVSALV